MNVISPVLLVFPVCRAGIICTQAYRAARLALRSLTSASDALKEEASMALGGKSKLNTLCVLSAW